MRHVYGGCALRPAGGPRRGRPHFTRPPPGRGDEGPIKQILGSFPNIDASGITSSADQGDVVELRYIDQNRRVERQTSFMNPVLPADIDKVLDADMFVCVPITDYEVGQPTLRHIKENSPATAVLHDHNPPTTL